MTIEQIIEQYPIALAEKEGKKIQYYWNGKWIDCIGSVIYGKEKLRIKPEPTKRLPTIEEVEKWYLENRVFMYKVANKNILHRIQSIDKRECEINHIQIGSYWRSIEDFCSEYTNYDGSTLYITE